MKNKPLGQKAYGHIPHLPNSRMGTGDHHCAPGQAKICTEKLRDKHDLIVVQEKLDGSCCAVAKLEDNKIIALGRSGYLASSSEYEQHQLFAHWVRENIQRFDEILNVGERIVGEWLVLAHGTRYELKHEPFVAFDIMKTTIRTPFFEFMERLKNKFVVPRIINIGGAISVEEVQRFLTPEYNKIHGALDPIEGAIWRVERKGTVDFLAKWVRSDKKDGCYLSKESGREEIWNWRPDKK